ncbi:hypothetical protein P7K49_032689 [Saguinus oedipus]|uniref:Uncharacterized protein n=1 Tax=Saguinus oedipus TaxID=9490 RepID=A0ABQ9TRH4_SAGOE|nr:hypothetical protein P7K49_032689 [Saguinus oedipus]
MPPLPPHLVTASPYPSDVMEKPAMPGCHFLRRKPGQEQVRLGAEGPRGSILEASLEDVLRSSGGRGQRPRGSRPEHVGGWSGRWPGGAVQRILVGARLGCEFREARVERCGRGGGCVCLERSGDLRTLSSAGTGIHTSGPSESSRLCLLAQLGVWRDRPLPLTVLQARVRQLQAESVSEVTVNRVDVARLPEHGSGDGGCQPPTKVQPGAEGTTPGLFVHWAKRLDKDKRIQQMRRQRLEKQLQKRAQNPGFSPEAKRLHVEPRLLSKQLTTCLQGCTQEVAESPWEEQLTQVLQEAPRKLSLDKKLGQQLKTRFANRQQKILAFLKCCLLTGHQSLAHHLLVTHHSRGRSQKLLTLDMYNTVMLGWARQVLCFVS